MNLLTKRACTSIKFKNFIFILNQIHDLFLRASFKSKSDIFFQVPKNAIHIVD